MMRDGDGGEGSGREVEALRCWDGSVADDVLVKLMDWDELRLRIVFSYVSCPNVDDLLR
jgi:hypothetical protein